MAAPEHDIHPYEHAGRWTEEDFLELPVDQRIELIDGSLLVSPISAHRHQWLALGLCTVLNSAAPPGTRALGPVNVRVGAERILIPDVAVVDRPTKVTVVSDAASVRLVVEIVSPGNAFMDRAVKPQLYAAAGIGQYLRVELGRGVPVGHLHRLEGDSYREVATGTTLEMTEPFAVSFDLAALDDLDDG